MDNSPQQDHDQGREEARDVSSQTDDAALGLSALFPGISARDELAYMQDGGDYPPTPLLERGEGVPAGAITHHRLGQSQAFPDNEHDYAVYVPDQYRADLPVGVLIFLDGEMFLPTMPSLLDNLIHEGRIPPVIAIFSSPGRLGPGYPIYGGTGNRAVEYDAVSGRLAEFLAGDILGEVGDRYAISSTPGCHAIVGMSSGGSAAFGAAWYRPDLFGRVLSIVGSFVNVDGADAWPSIVRRSEQRPIRIWLQDGARDLDTVFGNWPLANRQMAAALSYRDYHHHFEYGEGGHNLTHFLSIADRAITWLYRG